jgi:crossover junction endodeoxyribonuclease RusA
MTTLTIPGIPQTKGSTRSFMAGGRIVTTSANPNLKSWEHAVRVTAIEAGLTPTTGRVEVVCEFVMPRPKGHYGAKGILPRCADMPHTKKPDLDKLVRAILDALTGVAYVDDAQVRWLSGEKRYAGEGEHPGALVKVGVK